MKYLIGIDSGGTKSECVITDLRGKVLVKNSFQSKNYLITGAKKTSIILLNLILDSLKKINGTTNDATQIVIGIAGAGRIEDAKKLEREIKKIAKLKNQKLNELIVVSDALIALEGAFKGLPGCIIISGTGSISFGKDKSGILHRTGGMGRLIGDEGSGNSIGRKAIQHLSKQLDGRTTDTEFKNVLCTKLKIKSSSQLIDLIYNKKYELSSIVPEVLKLAMQKDKTALKILNEEVDELVLHIKAIKIKLKTKKMDVAFVGSLIENKNNYSQLLFKKIKSTLKDVNIIKPKLSPAEGAILIAKRMFNEQ